MMKKLEDEFYRLLEAVKILDSEWVVQFRDICKAAKLKGYHQKLLFKAGIAALTHRLVIDDLSPRQLVKSFLFVNRQTPLTLSDNIDEWRDQILALVAVLPGQTEARLVEKFALESHERKRLFAYIQEMIEDGDLRIEQRQHYKLVHLPLPSLPSQPGRHGTASFGGVLMSNQQLADHPANVYGLSYKSISDRIKAGMKPLEALTTPRKRN